MKNILSVVIFSCLCSALLSATQHATIDEDSIVVEDGELHLITATGAKRKLSRRELDQLKAQQEEKQLCPHKNELGTWVWENARPRA
jgi:hypothetical protein